MLYRHSNFAIKVPLFFFNIVSVTNRLNLLTIPATNHLFALNYVAVALELPPMLSIVLPTPANILSPSITSLLPPLSRPHSNSSLRSMRYILRRTFWHFPYGGELLPIFCNIIPTVLLLSAMMCGRCGAIRMIELTTSNYGN